MTYTGPPFPPRFTKCETIENCSLYEKIMARPKENLSLLLQMCLNSGDLVSKNRGVRKSAVLSWLTEKAL